MYTERNKETCHKFLLEKDIYLVTEIPACKNLPATKNANRIQYRKYISSNTIYHETV